MILKIRETYARNWVHIDAKYHSKMAVKDREIMNKLALYSKEDLIILNSMVDIEKHNPNLVYPLVLHYDENEISRLYTKDEIMKAPIETIYRQFMDFLTPTRKYRPRYFEPELLYQLFMEEPLENVPLYIGEPNNLSIIAHWRLKIGK